MFQPYLVVYVYIHHHGNHHRLLMMSEKRGSNVSLNILEEKVIGNLMDCSRASFEFKGHRRAHSSGSQGM